MFRYLLFFLLENQWSVKLEISEFFWKYLKNFIIKSDYYLCFKYMWLFNLWCRLCRTLNLVLMSLKQTPHFLREWFHWLVLLSDGRTHYVCWGEKTSIRNSESNSVVPMNSYTINGKVMTRLKQCFPYAVFLQHLFHISVLKCCIVKAFSS